MPEPGSKDGRPLAQVRNHSSAAPTPAPAPAGQQHQQSSASSLTPRESSKNQTKQQRQAQKQERRLIKEIGKKHPEYELTAAMMLGIRTTVGRAEGRAPRPLRLEDIEVSTKLWFPSAGSMLTPAHSMRDFKFKDYAPEVFRHIRERFGINPADYLLTVCGSFRYLEFISNSKSGQFFFYTHNRKFMIKTISKGEANFLRQILPAYYDHLMNNPCTLLAGFYGLHRVRPHKRKTFYFLVMASVFYTSRFIHNTFDLKGSLQGREVSPEERQSGNCVYKDKDFLKMKVQIKVGPARAQLLKKQLRSDVEFLRSLNIMDYSLLLGVHYKDRSQPNEMYTIRRQSMHSRQSSMGLSRQITMNGASGGRLEAARRFSFGSGTGAGLESNPRALVEGALQIPVAALTAASAASEASVGGGVPMATMPDSDPEADEDDLLTLPRSRNGSQAPLPGVGDPDMPEARQADYGLPKRYNRRSRPMDSAFVGRFLEVVEPRRDELPGSAGRRARASSQIMPPRAAASEPLRPRTSLGNLADGHIDGLQPEFGMQDSEEPEVAHFSDDSDSDDPLINSNYNRLPEPPQVAASAQKVFPEDARQSSFIVPVESIFCSDDGGCPGQLADGRPSNEVYYFGIIDILTEYNTKKRLESTWKSIRYDKRDISAVNPRAYGARFIHFLDRVIQ